MALSGADFEGLRVAFDFRCGYCGVRETDTGATLTVDHFHPRAAGGPDTRDNGVYSCHACNEFKGAYWNPDGVLRILHPRRDALSEHLEALPDGTLHGLTETGAFHIRRLKLNRPALVAHRLEERARQRDRERIATIEAELERIGEALEGLLHRFSGN